MDMNSGVVKTWGREGTGWAEGHKGRENGGDICNTVNNKIK
jgi:hypothetical protein